MRPGRTLALTAALAGIAGGVIGAPASASSTERGGGQSCRAALFDPATPYEPAIDPASFTTDIDNTYLPLQPGARWVYRARTDEGLERTVVTVTDRTRTIMGVETVIVHDVDRLDGEVIEDTFDYFAQDAEGCVWYFGERTREFIDGVPDPSGSWIAGRDGAQPGVVMVAAPIVGDAYRQEYLLDEAEDQATILRTDTEVTIPFGAFADVLVTRDFTALEPGKYERKFYAPGIGLILTVHGPGARVPARLVRYDAP